MKEAVLGVLVSDTKVWLGLRRNKPKVWSPPGGFVEENESREAALCRELEEEVGVCPDQAVEVGSFWHRGVLVRVYAGRVNEKDVALRSGEFSEGRWWSVDELPSPLSPSARLLQRAVWLAKSARLVQGAGNPEARVAFVGEAPGKEEIEAGLPFVGPAGKWLEEHVLRALGLSRDEVWLTNAIPVPVEEPRKQDAERWRGFLLGELERVQPEVVVALGDAAVWALLGREAEPGTWHDAGGRRIFVMRHPAYAMRFGYPELEQHLGSLARAVTAVAKAIQQPFASWGGKKWLAKKIIALMPEHAVYVEPFCGAAAVFWRKERSSKEVLNDKNADLIATLKFLRDASDRELEELAAKDWVGSEQTFGRLLDSSPKGELERAYRFLYLTRFGYLTYASSGSSFSHSEEGHKSALLSDASYLRRVRERLKGVTLLNRDALPVIEEYDSPETFFYIDPPYPTAERPDGYTPEDFMKLLGTLKRLKGRFILSCLQRDLELVSDLPASWSIRRARTRATLSRARGNVRRFEVLVANFDVQKVSLAELADPRTVGSLPDSELRAKHWRLHQNWALRAADESLLNAHLAVVREMARRGMTHRTEDLDSLDEQTFRIDPELRERFRELAKGVRPEAAEFFAGAKDFVYVHDYISLTGSFVYPQATREPNDIDFVIRQSFADPKLELKLVKMAKTLAPGLKPHFIYDPAGGSFHHLPLYDLVVRRKAHMEPRVVEEPEYAEEFYETSTLKQAETWTRFVVSFDGSSFTTKQVEGAEPFEPHPPYEVAGEFYQGESEDDVRKWVASWLQKGQFVAIQPKFDGLRFLCHKRGEEVEFYTADTLAPRAEVLRSLAEEFRKIPAESAIIDAELVEYEDLPWKEHKPKPRYQMVWLSTAKDYDSVKDREANVVAFCHDVTYLNGKNVSALGYAERLDLLREAVGEVSGRVVVAPTWEVKKLEDLEGAVRNAFSFEGSEGAMLKASGFPYKIHGANQGVAKFKKVVEIDCLIIGYRPQTKGKPKSERWTREEALERLEEQLDNDTYLFRCALLSPEGKLIPVEANHIITKQDIDLDWDVERQEWEGQEGPRFWRMEPGWPHVKEGDIAYGKTYARKWEYDIEPLGFIVTVAPVEIQVFDKPDGTKGIAWMFPRVRNFEERGSPIARLDHVLAAFGYDPELWKEIVPSHQPVEKRVVEDEEEELKLTHEEQRKLEQELYGDPYLVRQPPPRGERPSMFPWSLMRHIRGVWSRKQREELARLLEDYRKSGDAELRRRINREFEPWYFVGDDFEGFLREVWIAGEEEADVAAAVERQLKKGLPEGDIDPDRVYARGNAHLDWRFRSPEGEWLFGWTLATPSVALQALDGSLIFPLRDKVLEHKQRDNVVAVRKSVQPVAWLTVVGADRPILEVEPGQVGATVNTAGEFHFLASGDYVMGVSKTDAHEYFIFVGDLGPGVDARRLSGRWVFRMIQGSFKDLPRSVWIASKPFTKSGLLPYVLTHSREKEEEKAKRENVKMFWNGPETIANLRLLGYPALPENAEEIAEQGAEKRLQDIMPIPFSDWGRREGYIYVELFDFSKIRPETALILPFAGRERAWEVTASFREPVPDPWKEGKKLEKGVVGYLFDASAWTPEQVAELLRSMGYEPGEDDGKWRLVQKRAWQVRVVKAARRLVTGVVMEPGVVDAQGDFATAEEIEEAMVRFMRDYANRGLQHRDFSRNLRIIESWIVREDYMENGELIRKGTWMMTMWVGDDEVWEQVERGELRGFSIGGTCRRVWVPEEAVRAT